MKKTNLMFWPNVKMALVLFAFFGVLLSCSSDDSEDSGDDGDDLELVGQEGNPRFNLQFTNGDNVDLDLYVETPNGETLFYGNKMADNGELDVDCMCSSCPQGPNENIFWENGTAPSGTYKYWVNYYSGCGGEASSDFTLRVIKNGTVLTTKTGTLSSGQTTEWTHEQP
jgi:uncharacterized protein YfaP (DUF2135 family)